VRLRAGVILGLTLLGGGLSVGGAPAGWRLWTAATVCYGLAWTYAIVTRPRGGG
jgi:hypothetical protein